MPNSRIKEVLQTGSGTIKRRTKYLRNYDCYESSSFICKRRNSWQLQHFVIKQRLEIAEELTGIRLYAKHTGTIA